MVNPSEPNNSNAQVPDLERQGVHRAPVARRGWVTFAWAALATGVLVGVGTLGLFAYNGKLNIAAWFAGGAKPTPTVTAAPTMDPKMAIDVLNGTATTGLATNVGGLLTNAGWHVATMSNASQTNFPKTIVFYSVQGSEGAARGVCQTVGSHCQIKLSSAFKGSVSPLTLVLGTDYVLPVVSPTPTPSQ